MPADVVVGASLRGLERGRTIVVPGLAYKFLVLLSRLTPQRLKRAMVSVYAWRTGRP
jgi:short-subunit dehydrogenase